MAADRRLATPQLRYWCALVLLATGCRLLPTQLALPDRHAVTRDQLVFHSDFALPHHHRLVAALQAERDDVCRLLDIPPTDEPIHVFLFRDEPTYMRFVNDGFPNVPRRRAFFVETDTRLEVYAHWNDRVGEDLRHEVAHGYLHAAVPNLPLWVDEGLAEYFEVPRGHHGLNRPHVELLQTLGKQEKWRPDLSRLDALQSAGQMTQEHYAEAWAWIHFLIETDGAHRQALQQYLADLRQHGTTKPLSERLRQLHVEPEATLSEYISDLSATH